MSLVKLDTPLLYGFPPAVDRHTALSFNTSGILNADADRVATVFSVPETMTVAKVSFLTAAITTGSTGVRVTIETLTVAGIYSGTLVNANATVDVAVADTDDNTWKADNAFPGTFVLTAGDLVALVIKRIPGNTFNGTISRQTAGGALAIPYGILNTTGTDSKNSVPPHVGLELSNGSKPHIPGLYAFSATSVTAFTSASTPDEKGMQFQFPIRARVAGLWWYGLPTADVVTGITYAASLYEGTTQRATKAVDYDIDRLNTEGLHPIYFTAPFTIAANTDYITALAPGTVNLAVREFTLPAAAWMTATAFGATTALGATRTNAGAWTTSGTTYTLCGPIIDQVERIVRPRVKA